MTKDKLIKASIIGVTGYTGLETLRLLLAHPHVEITYLTSRQHDNTPIGDAYPHLANYDLILSNTDIQTVAHDSDVVFVCLPHKTAQSVVAELFGKTKIIDLSADYRLDDTDIYEQYYNIPHLHPELLGKAVYGMPELNKGDIKKADLVANPGCFALLSQLILLPFAGNIDHADIFAVTGSSGAGKSATDGTHHPIRNHNIKSYNINQHRHIPEILKTAKLEKKQLNFVPSSGPFTRGIFATAFIKTNTPLLTSPLEGGGMREVSKANAELTDSWVGGENPAAKFYKDAPFIRIQDPLELASIVGSNYCDLSYRSGEDNVIIAQGALDNLVKGASGCAIQNMNIMMGWDETIGLKQLSPLYP